MKQSVNAPRQACGVEMLERRVLLAAAVGHAANAIKPLAKLDTALASVSREYANYRAAGKAAANFHSKIKSLPTVGSSVRLVAYTKASPKTLEKSLAKLGAAHLKRFANGVCATVPLDKLTQLAAVPELWFARPIWAYTKAGNTLTQADSAERADIARTTYGFNGAGVKVGVLSDSFNLSGNGSYATDISTGDLPAGVNVLEDENTSLPDAATPTDEGRAMAQLVYDLAPGVSLDFASAFNGEADFASNILALRDDGAKVIVDDVGYLDEPMFQDGPIAQAVDNVFASGVSYFSSAGNSGRDSYESAYRPGNTYSAGSIPTVGGDAPTFLGGISQDFDPGAGIDDTQSFTLGNGDYIQLSFQWDQPYGSIPGSAACGNEMDAYVLDNSGTIVGGSTFDNLGNDPTEIFAFQNTGASQTFQLMLVWRDSAGGPQPGLVKYVNFGSASITDFATNSSTSFGHPNAAGAAGVAAVPFFAAQSYNLLSIQPEPFTSVGGTPILFDAVGNPITQVIRQQPRFAAIDGGNTSFFGTDDGSDVDSKPNFYGTSAAAPDAAAVAALMLQANPALTPTQVYTILQNTALDMDDTGTAGFDTGFDFQTGYGLIRADRALQAVAETNIIGQTFQDNNSNGTLDASDSPINGVNVYIDSNNNGAKDTNPGSIISSTNVPVSIPNVTTVSSNDVVSGLSGVITDLNVKLNINHTFDSDLTVYVISPKGERVELFDFIGGSSNNFTNTILDDEAANPISGASAPFNGTFRPFVPLSNFDGLVPNGTWKLEITDWAAPDTGTLTSWSLTIATTELAMTTAPAGNYTFAGLVAGNYNIRQQAPPSGFVQSVPASSGPRNVTTVAGATSANQSFSEFPLNFATGIGDDSYVLSTTGGGTNVQIVETNTAAPSTTTYTVPKVALGANALNFSSAAGDDSFTIDFADGSPITTGGMTWNAGADTGVGDKLFLIGATDAADTVAFDPTSITMNGALITPSGVESTSFDGKRGLDDVTINSGAVTFPATQQLQTLTIASGASASLASDGNRAIYTQNLSLTGTARLDLNDNDLLLDYTGSSPIGSWSGSTYTGVTGMIQSARNGGTWDGPGITTSAFIGNFHTLGVAESQQVNGAGTHLYAGETIDDTTVIVKYTYGGDTNLDGTLNIDDYIKTDTGFAGGLTGWSNGDFNYDGKVNIDDYSTVIDPNYPNASPPL